MGWGEVGMWDELRTGGGMKCENGRWVEVREWDVGCDENGRWDKVRTEGGVR